jgi:tetratricopeptide (TPR) repeat protein
MISKSSIHRVTAIALCTLWMTLSSAGASAQPGLVPWIGNDAEGRKCDGGQPEFGPYDYLHRNQLTEQLAVVERFHFDENVENLRKGISDSAIADVDYTLRAFPNHHRALQSAVKYRFRQKRWPKNSKSSKAECYLRRAIEFSPNDPTLQPLLAYVLHRLNKPQMAMPVYRKAIEEQPSNIMLQYNLGLALTDLKRYGEATKVANEVYAADFPLPGLRNRLIAAGTWKNTDKPSAKQSDTGKQLSDTPAEGSPGDTGVRRGALRKCR